ncbi:hypothetical protein K1719_045597 [Acacia pycnantha]|nr:hypothetical protein K1719_045597 [Acacia pycnantha]
MSGITDVAEKAQQLPGSQVKDLLGLIKSVERNIHLLNQAKVHAIGDLEKVLSEKEALQGEINLLEMRLAETDAWIKVATQEKIRVEHLENHLEALRNEMNRKGITEGRELNDVRNTGERSVMLEKVRTTLETAVKDFEAKLSVSQEDVSKLSTLRVEYKNLSEKVENLQLLLDKATKQADQATIVLQENQHLQRKIKLLEDHIQKSDKELQSYVQLYHESVMEFQDTVNTLKEESKRRALDEPVEDMPLGFWSQLLVKIDGWSLEKKISTDDAVLLTIEREGVEEK